MIQYKLFQNNADLWTVSDRQWASSVAKHVLVMDGYSQMGQVISKCPKLMC